MKVRESGMPEEAYWESLFDIPVILKRMAITADIDTLIEFGCGYGTFTIPVCRIIRGTVIGLDIDSAMIARTKDRLAAQAIDNVDLIERDFIGKQTGLSDNSADYVMLFNILHHDQPEVLVLEARRLLRPGGFAGIIHWRTDLATPRGPALDIRPTPESLVTCCRRCGLLVRGDQSFLLPPWHYGILATK